MKKGIDVKVIDRNIGIPVRPLDKPFNAKEVAKLRLACDNAQNNYWDRLRNIEDIEYIDVTNEPEHIAFLGHPLNHK